LPEKTLNPKKTANSGKPIFAENKLYIYQAKIKNKKTVSLIMRRLLGCIFEKRWVCK
jgi:hypothetical protein